MAQIGPDRIIWAYLGNLWLPIGLFSLVAAREL